MGVNKLVINEEVKLDLSDDTVQPDKLLAGETAHDKAGEPITGTLSSVAQAVPTFQSSIIKESGTSYFQLQATATQQAGVVPTGTKSAVYKIPANSALVSSVPGTTRKLALNKGHYTTSDLYIAGEPNLLPENIRAGVSMFGVWGKLVPGYKRYDVRCSSNALYGSNLPEDLTNAMLFIYPVLNSYEVYDPDVKMIVAAIHDGSTWELSLYQNNYFFLEGGEFQHDSSAIYMEDPDYTFVAGAPYVLLVPSENT